MPTVFPIVQREPGYSSVQKYKESPDVKVERKDLDSQQLPKTVENYI